MRSLRVVLVLGIGVALFILLGAPRPPSEPPAGNEPIPIVEELDISAVMFSEPDSIPLGNATHVSFLGKSSSNNPTFQFRFMATPGKFNDAAIPKNTGGSCIFHVDAGLSDCRVQTGNFMNTFKVGGPHLAVFISASVDATVTLLAYPTP